MAFNSNRDPVVLERRFVPEGALIIRQGEEGDCAFLIQSGKVSIFKMPDDVGGQEVELAQLDTGGIFGEMSLLFDGPRSAAAKALEDCTLIVITRQVFEDKMRKSDPTIRALLHMLTQRIMNGNNVLMNQKNNVSDLNETANIIYDNILRSLPAEHKSGFEETVFPKLQAFLKSINVFHDEHIKK